jgi:hypothetical protein
VARISTIAQPWASAAVVLGDIGGYCRRIFRFAEPSMDAFLPFGPAGAGLILLPPPTPF